MPILSRAAWRPFPRQAAGAVLAAGLCLAAGAAAAQYRENELAGAWDGGVLTIQIENDWFGGAANKDRHYSTGLRANWMSPTLYDAPMWLRDFTDLPESFLSFLDSRPAGKVKRRYGLSVGQSLYTPEDKQATALLKDERPYAAWLYVGFSLQTIRYDAEKPDKRQDAIRQDTWQLDVGMIGPAALGRQVQNNWHKVIGVEQSKGWDNQLKNELGVNLTFERKWRIGRTNLMDDPIKLRVDMIPMVGLSLGNVNTYAAAGGIVRIGQDLGNDFGPPRIRPSLPGSETFDLEDPFGWYLFAGVEGSAVARNIALDGNTFRDSHSVDKNPFVADFLAGAAIFLGRTRLAYTHVLRTKEYKGQKGMDQYGALTFSVGF
ncbi:MAG: lipid A deacylase LpxR family protein [Reyranellaceae bacterium]